MIFIVFRYTSHVPLFMLPRKSLLLLIEGAYASPLATADAQ